MKKLLLSLGLVVFYFNGMCIFNPLDKQFFKEINEDKKIPFLSKRRATIRDGEGRTALMLAAKNGNISLVEKLLKYGADINAKDNNGRTALMWAAKNRKVSVVKELLKHGVDIDAKDNNGGTAHTYALTAFDEASAKIEAHSHNYEQRRYNLSGYMSVESRLEDEKFWAENAIMELRNRKIEELENAGTGIDAKSDNHGSTALMQAARDGNIFLVRKLIEHGANVNAKDNDDNTALIYAIQGYIRSVNNFEDEISDLDSSDAKNEFYRFGVERERIKGTLKELRNNGADATVKNKNGKTYFDYTKEVPKGLDMTEKQEKQKPEKKMKKKRGKNQKSKLQNKTRNRTKVEKVE